MLGIYLLAVLFGSLAIVCAGSVRAVAGERTPVYLVENDPQEVKRLREVVAPLMAMSEQEMVALVPDRTGFRFVGCPACDEGTQEGQLTWSILDPHRVKCRFCETSFPNEKFLEDEVLKVINPVG
ncbi:MAG: hypothetical protein O2954_17780, partial [bacterium]|nr:hypothetical protein [bacterium]